MEKYLLIIGIVLVVFGLIRMIRDLYVVRKNDRINGVIVKVKNKTKKSGRYCYPKVEFDDNGSFVTMSCPSVRRSGHDKFPEKSIELYRYMGFFGRTTYKAVERFWFSSIQLASLGVIVIVAHFFVN